MEKWCDGIPSMGLTNNFHNLLETFRHFNKEATIQVLHIDEMYHRRLDINDALPKIIDHYKIDTVIFSFLGDVWFNPKVETCKNLKARLVFMWPDIGYSWAVNKINQLPEYTHISWGGENQLTNVRDHRQLWCPQSEDIYFPDKKERQIGFIGSMNHYKDRTDYISYMGSKGIEVFQVGGQRESKLSAQDYAKYIRTTSINLNFPESPSGVDQMKGRVIEVIASQSLLLEKKGNHKIHNYLTEGKEYLTFETKEDLHKLLVDLLKSPTKIEDVSLAGYQRYKKEYTSDRFWQLALQ